MTVAVQIQVAEPCRAEMDCARCGGIRFTFPLVGLLRTGVAQAGQLTLCAACDTPQHAVREHTIRPQRDGLPK